MIRINSLIEIEDKYDYYIVDIWGVLYDGSSFYSAAYRAVHNLIMNKKNHVVFLTNSSRSQQDIYTFLGALSKSAAGIVTSADATKRAIMTFKQMYGNRCFHNGRPYITHNTGCVLVNSIDEADFFVLSRSGENYDAYMNLQRMIPLICANPDQYNVVNNHKVMCPGSFADRYQDMGGVVEFCGKPYSAVYNQAMALLKITDNEKRVLCIGDALMNDIIGANKMGFDSLLITGGVHRFELDNNPTHMMVTNLCLKYGTEPTYYMYYLKQ